MISKLTKKLIECPSYFRWSNKRLAQRFNCSERTVKRVKNALKTHQSDYEASL
jgi:AraC-like DNA-binding protein